MSSAGQSIRLRPTRALNKQYICKKIKFRIVEIELSHITMLAASRHSKFQYFYLFCSSANLVTFTHHVVWAHPRVHKAKKFIISQTFFHNHEKKSNLINEVPNNH